MEHTIKLVEQATENNKDPIEVHNGISVNPNQEKGQQFMEITGYVQQIYMSNLQGIAERLDAIITINAVPGTFQP
jgi:uncharacterized membrane protein